MRPVLVQQYIALLQTAVGLPLAWCARV